MEEYFELAIRSNLLGQYCLLIVDRYVSNISTEFIKCTWANKIICCYLSLYLTYMLQPLDINVFKPLK